MSIVPSRPDGYRLMMEGAQALTDVEERGMRIDVEYLEKAIVGANARAEYLWNTLRDDPIYRLWRKVFGADADLGKRQQLASILFDEMGYECKFWTEGGGTKKRAPATDKTAFEHIDEPFIGMWLEYLSLKARISTDLIGTKRQIDNRGFLHPVYNLHFVVTYRSGCRDPNFMNKPTRDKKLAKLVRRMFVPRTDKHFLAEIDFGAHEWKGAANFWKDPQMIKDASDPSRDVHRDMAATCYKLPTDQVSKAARAVGKNKFVFPSLYGSYYKSTGRDMWDGIRMHDLKTVDGRCLKDHLVSKGLTDFDAFLRHMKEVDEQFNARYPHWSRKKVEWWDAYVKNGAFPLLSGFACRGIYSYNDTMNYPIQGPSFHVLLWSLVEMNRWLMSNKMRSCVIGQIHDSIMLDVHEDEKDDVFNKLIRIMTKETVQHFNWIVVPPEAEVEASDDTWFEKRPWVEKNGTWQAK